MSDKARKVIATLETKPELLYEVLRILQDEYAVASPWQMENGDWVRLDTGRFLLARVKPSGSQFLWHYYNDQGGTIDSGTDSTLFGAKARVDSWLKDAGFLLS